MLEVCQPRKYLSCSKYFAAEIPTKLNRYFYHYNAITFYIHYFVQVMVQGYDSSKKQPYSWQMAGYYQQD